MTYADRMSALRLIDEKRRLRHDLHMARVELARLCAAVDQALDHSLWGTTSDCRALAYLRRSVEAQAERLGQDGGG